MEKKIAIQGHNTRGAEVIKALELMGFKNTYGLEGEVAEYFYCSGINDSIDAKVFNELEDDYTPMTLETYLKSLPKAEIAERLVLPQGKESMEDIKLDIPNGYEFFGIDDDNRIVLTKIQSKYPKTYEECCNILDVEPYSRSAGYKSDLVTAFRNLLICRDAYWKIAGEQMGLGKPWEPDWRKADERKYCIVNTGGSVTKWIQKTTNKILAFPTEGIRDAFFENFKELIELCKELL